MKKTIFLAFVLLSLLIAGCNEKKLISQIDGTWHVQKYAVAGADRTRWFDSTYNNFRWNFSGNRNFTKTYNIITNFVVYNYDTIAHLDTMTHSWVVDSVTSTRSVIPTTIGQTIKGDWYLTNGNYYLETRDSVVGTRQYQIIDHSGSSLHLLDGNIDYYLAH